MKSTKKASLSNGEIYLASKVQLSNNEIYLAPKVQLSNNVEFVNAEKKTVQFILHTYADIQELLTGLGKKELSSCLDKQLLELISDCTILNRRVSA